MAARKYPPQPIPPTTARSAVLRVTWLPVTPGCTPRLAQISQESMVVNSSVRAFLPHHRMVFIGLNAGSLGRSEGQPSPTVTQLQGQQGKSPAPPSLIVQLSQQAQ